ncbi:GDSL esterase/lipase [Euphorbia peplus]|nr:GDSL esterase/lipase [Euphorbia peplus]
MFNPNTSSLFSVIFLLIFTSFFPLNCYSQPQKNGNNSTKLKGMFVFGSSLADNGNNAFLDTVSKPIKFPYGVDFPLGPTGRYNNGKTVIDFLSELLQFPNFLPPFYDPSTHGSKILNGVNFASGGSGLLDDTGAGLKVPSMNKQMNNFVNTTLPELEKQLGMKREQFLGDYMFLVATAANDIGHYFGNPFKFNQTVEAYTSNLSQLLSAHVKNLYKLGGRKFVFIAVYPMGCYPRSVDQNRCNETLNSASKTYNSHLKTMIDDLNPQMPGSHLVFVNTFDIVLDMINRPTPLGFKDVENACCELDTPPMGKKTHSHCKKDNPKVCEDRKSHVFFDEAHTSEAANKVIATTAFDSKLQSLVYPINIAQLSLI